MAKTMCRLWHNFNTITTAIVDARGLDASKLSRASGVSRQAIHNYWIGKSVPGLERVEMIAKGLGVEPQVLLADPDLVNVNDIVSGWIEQPDPVQAERLLGERDRAALAIGRRLMKIENYDRLLDAGERMPVDRICRIAALLDD